MKAKKHDTRWMVSVALMAAIVIVLANTPLGMIQLPIIKATTVHIPVILGAILLGPGAGAILGAVFGICSLVSNTMAPTLLSFAFSPFLSTTGIPGALKAIWISVGCRILIGVVAGWLWVLFTKIKLNQFSRHPDVHTGVIVLFPTDGMYPVAVITGHIREPVGAKDIFDILAVSFCLQQDLADLFLVCVHPGNDQVF